MSVRSAVLEAERIIDQLGYTRSDLPINVETIAKDLDLCVVKTELDDDVSGLLVAKKSADDQVHIFVNIQDSPVRRRFTISHEIGHHVLGHKFDSSGVHIDRGNYVIPRKTKNVKYEPREVEANEFAACLLMPARLVFETVGELSQPLFDQHVTQLSRIFHVSEQAMTIRLTRLGILS